MATRAKLVYVTASRHAPLGIPLALPRRLALLEWAESSGAYIVEDDYDSEYRYRGRPIPALLGLDRSQRVILAGTFSKLLFPGLRLAYLVVPDRLVSPFTRALSITSRFENGLTQATLAEFMTEGHFDRHVRRMRQIYAARAQAFEAAAQSCWKGFIEVEPIQAGLDVTARIAVDRSDVAVVKGLTQLGVEVQPLSAYCSSHLVPPGLVMGFAAFNETQILRAARDVAKGLGI